VRVIGAFILGVLLAFGLTLFYQSRLSRSLSDASVRLPLPCDHQLRVAVTAKGEDIYVNPKTCQGISWDGLQWIDIETEKKVP
jgi:hypothetical protein